MNYLSTKEISERWNISDGRIRELAEQGRIEGAQLVGNNWIIPENAQKPIDGRTLKIKKTENTYKFPLLIFGNYSKTQTENFTEEEKRLYHAQRQYCSCNIKQAKQEFEALLENTQNTYIKIGTLYFLCFVYLHTRETDKLNNTLFKTRLLFETDFDFKEELFFIMEDLQATFISSQNFYDTCKKNFTFNYSSQAEPFIVVTETCNQLSQSITDRHILNTNLFELFCAKFEKEQFLVPAMYMHHYVGTMYQLNKNMETAKKHFKKAIELSISTKCYAPLLGLSFANFELYEVLLKDSQNYSQAIKYHRTFVEDYAVYLEQSGKKTYFKNITEEDFKYINYILLGMTNKMMAEEEKKSESLVNKKLFKIYEKLHVNNKKQLLDLVISSLANKSFN